MKKGGFDRRMLRLETRPMRRHRRGARRQSACSTASRTASCGTETRDCETKSGTRSRATPTSCSCDSEELLKQRERTPSQNAFLGAMRKAR